MNKFFSRFLASLAAIWVTIAIIGFFGIFMIVVMVAAGDDIKEVRSDSVLVLDLDAIVADRPEPVDIMTRIAGGGSSDVLPLNQVVAALRHARDDKHISGLLIKAGGPTMGMAQAQAIHEAVTDFRSSGKWAIAYGDTYTQGDYIVASAADSVLVNPIGMIDIHGLESTTMYFKDFLEKVGVEVQVVKVGTYKSAVEPFLLNDISEANREQQEAYLGTIWKSLASTIARGRNLEGDSIINHWADSYAMTQPAEWYEAQGIVDGLRYRHQVDETLRALTGLDPDDDVRSIDILDYYTARGLDKSGSGKGKKMIAILYAVGDITEDGQGGIASSRLVPEIFKLIDNDDVDGLILRVNSGGGSAFASEQIWEALEQFKARTGKPFYVSMGDVAASGGYYISCGADKIYAEPVTLTGSIGIFGMIPNAANLLNDKIGINTATVATNQPSISLFKPMSEGQRAAMQGYVDRGYDLFTRRCAEGRHMSQDSIKAIAEGRVWAGQTALTLGLVDHLGSLDDCVAAMAEALGAGKDGFYTRDFPKLEFSFVDELFNAASGVRASVIERSLGTAAPYWRAISTMNGLDPVQARMDFIEIR